MPKCQELSVDHQLHFFAGRVFALVGDDLDVVETKLPAVETVAANDENISALDFVILFIRELVAQPVERFAQEVRPRLY